MTNYAWHVHHNVLFEALTEPLETRIAYITEQKSRDETPEQIALRLRLLKVITGPEIAECDRITQLARAEYSRLAQLAWAEYSRIMQLAWKKIEALHAQQCPNCPWDGNTIFATRNG